MPGFTARIKDFRCEVRCALHHAVVVGAVLELGLDHGKCLKTRHNSCQAWWYVEGTYVDFDFPGDEHVRPAG